MIPLDWPITIYQGDDFDETLRLYDEDPAVLFTLAGMIGKAQIRATEGDSTVLAECTVALLDQAAVPGGFIVTLTPAQTAALPPSELVWDCQFANGTSTIVDTYLKGKVTVIAQVSR